MRVAMIKTIDESDLRRVCGGLNSEQQLELARKLGGDCADLVLHAHNEDARAAGYG